jgi:hypothetical protein
MAEHTGMNDDVWPAQATVNYLFPGTHLTEKEKIRITWYNGGLKPKDGSSQVPKGIALPDNGSLIIGEEGTVVLPHYKEPVVYPKEKYPQGSIKIAEDLNHYHGFVDGCLSGKQPSDGFDYAGPLTEAVQLGNIAQRFPKKTLNWDYDSLRFTNHEAANQFVSRKYRKGWGIKGVS